jgi:hypothetical protein
LATKLKDIEKTDILNIAFQYGDNPTMGGDPEFFVSTKGNKVLASDKFFPSKDKPIVFKPRYNAVIPVSPLKLFFDGIQAEMNIGANTCREYLSANVQACLAKAKTILARKKGDYKVAIKPSTRVLRSEIMAADPEARRFGCAPDFNAYTLTTNTSEIDATNHPYRYAGGHMHFGVYSQFAKRDYEDGKVRGESFLLSEEGQLRVIKAFDLFVGTACSIFDVDRYAKIRRESYGKAGCFRPTPYGIEYRTPSCWWLKSPFTTSLIFGLARIAWKLTANKYDEVFRDTIGVDEETIKGICDEGDSKEAKKLWKHMLPYVMLLHRISGNPLRYNTVVSELMDDRPEEYHYMHYSTGVKFWDPKEVKKRGIMEKWYGNKRTLLDLEKSYYNTDYGLLVSAPAAFAYAIKHGLNAIMSDNIYKNWSINTKDTSGHNFECTRGWARGNYQMLYKNIDFLKFQKSFIKSLI